MTNNSDNSIKLMEKPASYVELIENMTVEHYLALKEAVELGKWANGDKLTLAQRETCLQAIILYDQLHLPEAERVAYISKDYPTRCEKH
jgi:uncharacterized protein YeaC (DUF1315 family)